VDITAAMVKELREVTGGGLMACKKALVECNGDMEDSKELLRKKGQSIANKKSSRETKEGAIAICIKDKKAALIKIACETDFVAINDKFKDFIKDIAEQAIETGVTNLTEQTSSKGSIKEQFVDTISKLGENIVFLDGQYWEEGDDSVINSYTHTNNKIAVLVDLKIIGSADKEKVKDVARNIAMHIAASNVEAISEDDLDAAVVEKEKKFLIEQAQESGKPDNIIEKMVEGRLVKYKKEICLLYQNYVKDPDKTIEQYIADSAKEVGAELSVNRFYKEKF